MTKVVIAVLMVVQISVNIAMLSHMEQIKSYSKMTLEELRDQGKSFKNVNGFDVDEVPCAVFEAADGVIKCKQKGKQQ